MVHRQRVLWVLFTVMLMAFAGRLVSVPAPFVQAQDENPVLPSAELALPEPSGSATPQPQPSPAQSGDQSPSKSGDITPRDQLRQLFERRLELMNDADVSNEINVLQHNVAELEALKKLKEIQKSLTELIEVYPNTASANSAQLMLQQSSVRYHDPNSPFAPPPVFSPAGGNENGFGPPPVYHPGDGFLPVSPTIPESKKLRSAAPSIPSPNRPAKATSLAPVSTFPAGKVFDNEGF